MLTDKQRHFIELDRKKAQYKEFLEAYKKATEDLVSEVGIGGHFQDEQGVVYQTTEPDGRFVHYERFGVNRTRREGETRGSLAMKKAEELGYKVK